MCVKASIRGSQRCTFSGFPCSVEVDAKVLAELTKEGATIPNPQRADARNPLTMSEVKEMQLLLFRAGYRIWIDGIFGPQTRQALAAWQRRRRLPVNTSPTRHNLQDLRRSARA